MTTEDRRTSRGARRTLEAAISALLLVVLSAAAPTSAGAATVSKAELEAEVLALTNQHRATVGCGPLRMNSDLGRAARSHSGDMATRDFFDHIDPDGVDPFQRIGATGYSYLRAGENLAAGRWRPEDAVQQWLDSPPHRENIENCAFTEMGAGIAGNRSSTYRYYWTQVLATPTTAQAAQAESAPETVIGSSSFTSREPWPCGSTC